MLPTGATTACRCSAPTAISLPRLPATASLSKWGKEKLDANSEMWQERDIAQGLERERLFWGPIAVAVDDDDNVFVVESARSRIQVYRRQVPVFFGGRL